MKNNIVAMECDCPTPPHIHPNTPQNEQNALASPAIVSNTIFRTPQLYN